MTHPDKDSQAERAAFEKHFGPKDSFAWRNEDDSYKVAALQSAWEIWQAARAAPPALDAEGLLALVARNKAGDFESWVPVYTAEQVRQAQRDAVAADRRVLRQLDNPKMAEYLRNEPWISAYIETLECDLRKARQDQQPARASVDTLAFRDLATSIYLAGVCHSSSESPISALIAHINAWGGVKEDDTKDSK